jgi:hypothetical protein
MKILISEGQLNSLINLIKEENDYYDYSNISDKQKSDFARINAGHKINQETTPITKKKEGYVELWKWKSGLITKFPENWELFKIFPKWSFAKYWLNKFVLNPPDRTKYYKIISK